MKDGKPISVRKANASVSSTEPVIECRSRKITEEEDRESLSSTSSTSKTWSSSVTGMQKAMNGPYVMGPPIICPVVYVPVPYGSPYLPPHPQHYPPGPFLHPPHLRMLPAPGMPRPLMPKMPLPGASFHPFQLPPHHHHHEGFSVGPASSRTLQDDRESSASLSSSPPPAVTTKRILTISEPTTNQVLDMSDLKDEVSSDVNSVIDSEEAAFYPVPVLLDPKDIELKEFTASAQCNAMKGEQIYWLCQAEGFGAPAFLSRIALFPLAPRIGDWYLLTFRFYPRSVGISQCPVVRVSQAKLIEPPTVPYFWSREVSDALISPMKAEPLPTVRLTKDVTEAATSIKGKEFAIVAAICGAESEYEYELFTVPWKLLRARKPPYFQDNQRIGTWLNLIVEFITDDLVLVLNWAVATPLNSYVPPVECRVRNGRFEVRTRIGPRYRAPERMLYAQSEELGRVLDCDRRIWRTMKEKETLDCWCARREASDPSFEDAQWKVVEVIRDAVKAPTGSNAVPIMLSNGTPSNDDDIPSSTPLAQKLEVDTDKFEDAQWNVFNGDASKSPSPPRSVPAVLSNGTSSKRAAQKLDVDTTKVVTITAAINGAANEDEYELFTVSWPSKRLKAKKIFFRNNPSIGTWFKLVAQYVSNDTISVRSATHTKATIPTRICDGAFQVRTCIFDQALLFTEGDGARCAVLCAHSADLGRVMDCDGVLDHCFESEIDCWCARRAREDPSPKDVEWKIVALADPGEESVKEEQVKGPTTSRASGEESPLGDVKRELSACDDDTPGTSTWNCGVDDWDEKPPTHRSSPNATAEKSRQASVQEPEPEVPKLQSRASDAKTDKLSATAQSISQQQRYVAEGCQGVVCFKDAGLCFVYCAELGCEALLTDPPRYTDSGDWLEFNAIVGESSELLAVESKEIKPKFLSWPLYRSVLVECQVTIPTPNGSSGEVCVTSNFADRVLDKHGIVAAWDASPGKYKAVIRFVYEEGAPCGYWQLEYLEDKL
ncbi:hypothetical protein AAVH_15369 [Aphelenchoides avenae]|nr:hypothetical protein AAVH_15369 [Aphelenchus avenae]